MTEAHDSADARKVTFAASLRRKCAIRQNRSSGRKVRPTQRFGRSEMRFRLSPPGLPVFLVSLALAGAAIATLYTQVPIVGHYVSQHRFWVLAAAYALLFLGVVLDGL